jgi:16S rRNA (guanine527-N7)-methyltransferase
MHDEFVEALKTYQSAFGLELTDRELAALGKYYEIINEHNAILHLVAPMPAEEFAIRHILEPLTLLEYLPVNTRFADVGTGAGLPSIPCLLVRDDLRAVLIESKAKKSKFLDGAVERLELAGRVGIVNRQFEETEPGNCQFVTCRALDKFTEKLPRLLKWSMRRGLLFFGGRNLGSELKRQKVKFHQKLMPLSEQRYLFVVR